MLMLAAEVMSIYSILGQEFFMLHGANYTYTNESWPFTNLANPAEERLTEIHVHNISVVCSQYYIYDTVYILYELYFCYRYYSHTWYSLCCRILPYTETGSMCRLFATCRPPHFSGHFQKMLIQLLREMLPFQACRHIGINFSPGVFLVFYILKTRRKSSQHRQTIVFLAEDLNQEVELVTWNRKTDLV